MLAPNSIKRAGAGALVALLVAGPIAASARSAQPRPSSRSSKKALLSYPPKCLKRSGLGHIKSVRAGRWQGTSGNEPRTKINYSVFVQGPFKTVKAAASAARKDALVENAYPGGPFVVTITRKSYLTMEASFAAACLASLTTGQSRF